MLKYYILDDDHNAVAVDLMTWAKWFETADRVVRQEQIGSIFLSTVFLGFGPTLFETMAFGGKAFGGKDDVEQFVERCSTWDEAVAQHERMAEWLSTRLGIQRQDIPLAQKPKKIRHITI